MVFSQFKKRGEPKKLPFEISIRMLVGHCDKNHSYEITMNGYKARKINEKFSFNFLAQ